MSEAPNLPKTDPNAAQAERDHVIALAAFRAKANSIARMSARANAEGDEIESEFCNSLAENQIVQVSLAVRDAAAEIGQCSFEKETDKRLFREKWVGDISELLGVLWQLLGNPPDDAVDDDIQRTHE